MVAVTGHRSAPPYYTWRWPESLTKSPKEARTPGITQGLTRLSGLMWRTCLCGLQPVDAEDSALSGFERHITISSRARSARVWPGHVSPPPTNLFAEVDPEGGADSLAW